MKNEKRQLLTARSQAGYGIFGGNLAQKYRY